MDHTDFVQASNQQNFSVGNGFFLPIIVLIGFCKHVNLNLYSKFATYCHKKLLRTTRNRWFIGNIFTNSSNIFSRTCTSWSSTFLSITNTTNFFKFFNQTSNCLLRRLIMLTKEIADFTKRCFYRTLIFVISSNNFNALFCCVRIHDYICPTFKLSNKKKY